tara:strand:- start:768 stop:1484 length:717 start_codon:yes stop_codon:yes gene_type:complete
MFFSNIGMLIELSGVGKRYDMGTMAVHALREVDLRINEGEFVAITGPSGSGKSTLMNIIGCLDVPSSGDFYFNEENIKDINDSGLAKIRNQMIGFVFQSYNLLPRLTAQKNVELPLIYGNVKNRKDIASKALERVGLLNRSHHLPAELSGGQQQRVGIARALATEPSILLADEPTGNLDSNSTREILEIIKDLNYNQKLTVILVTHEADVASLAGRTIQMIDGKIVRDESKENILSNP